MFAASRSDSRVGAPTRNDLGLEAMVASEDQRRGSAPNALQRATSMLHRVAGRPADHALPKWIRKGEGSGSSRPASPVSPPPQAVPPGKNKAHGEDDLEAPPPPRRYSLLKAAAAAPADWAMNFVPKFGGERRQSASKAARDEDTSQPNRVIGREHGALDGAEVSTARSFNSIFVVSADGHEHNVAGPQHPLHLPTTAVIGDDLSTDDGAAFRYQHDHALERADCAADGRRGPSPLRISPGEVVLSTVGPSELSPAPRRSRRNSRDAGVPRRRTSSTRSTDEERRARIHANLVAAGSEMHVHGVGGGASGLDGGRVPRVPARPLGRSSSWQMLAGASDSSWGSSGAGSSASMVGGQPSAPADAARRVSQCDVERYAYASHRQSLDTRSEQGHALGPSINHDHASASARTRTRVEGRRYSAGCDLQDAASEAATGCSWQTLSKHPPVSPSGWYSAATYGDPVGHRPASAGSDSHASSGRATSTTVTTSVTSAGSPPATETSRSNPWSGSRGVDASLVKSALQLAPQRQGTDSFSSRMSPTPTRTMAERAASRDPSADLAAAQMASVGSADAFQGIAPSTSMAAGLHRRRASVVSAPPVESGKAREAGIGSGLRGKPRRGRDASPTRTTGCDFGSQPLLPPRFGSMVGPPVPRTHQRSSSLAVTDATVGFAAEETFGPRHKKALPPTPRAGSPGQDEGRESYDGAQGPERAAASHATSRPPRPARKTRAHRQVEPQETLFETDARKGAPNSRPTAAMHDRTKSLPNELELWSRRRCQGDNLGRVNLDGTAIAFCDSDPRSERVSALEYRTHDIEHATAPCGTSPTTHGSQDTRAADTAAARQGAVGERLLGRAAGQAEGRKPPPQSAKQKATPYDALPFKDAYDALVPSVPPDDGASGGDGGAIASSARRATAALGGMGRRLRRLVPGS